MIYGLTGGIGCGKSTVSHVARDLGAAIWCADAAVHRAYKRSVELWGFVTRYIPEAVERRCGGINRQVVARSIFADRVLYDDFMEMMRTPLREDRARFFNETKSDLIVLDVPLLFEAGMADDCDEIIVVYCSPEEQLRRVRLRGTPDDIIEMIRANQWTNEQRLARATHAIDTEMNDRDQVAAIVASILGRPVPTSA